VVVPKKIGRPPKVPTALETDDKIKQPNQRKNSVNKEHDENTLRRSARNKNNKNLMNKRLFILSVFECFSIFWYF